jgi:hypothetical protein
MRCILRIRYGKEILEEEHHLAGGTTSARALKAAERMLAQKNEGLPIKKQGVLLSIKPVGSFY